MSSFCISKIEIGLFQCIVRESILSLQWVNRQIFILSDTAIALFHIRPVMKEYHAVFVMLLIQNVMQERSLP